MATARDNLARKQIFIPATQPEEEIILRVAAYCRVSTDSQDQINSFTAQNNHYTEMITARDQWELVDIYADEGITGTLFAQMSLPRHCGIGNEVDMGVVTLVVKGSIPPQMFHGNLKILGKGLGLPPQEIPPAAASVKAQPGSILPFQGANGCIDIASIGILNGESITEVRFKYDYDLESYLLRHMWD